MYHYTVLNRLIGLVGRVFANGTGDLDSIPGRVIPKTLKMIPPCLTLSNIKYVSIYTNTSARVGYDTRLIFKQSLTGLYSEFSFSLTSCLTKAEEPSRSYYLLIAGGRIIGFIPFPRLLVLCEMQSASARIWTRVAVSISNDDYHYTTGAYRG